MAVTDVRVAEVEVAEADLDLDLDAPEEYESPVVHIRAAVCPENCY